METLRRTIFPKKNPVRLELERLVYAFNTALANVVGTMDNITLLRNAHPSFRSDYAYKMRDVGLIHEYEVSEFLQKEPSFKRLKWYV